MNSGAKSAALSVLVPLLLLALGFSVPLVIRARRAAREAPMQSAAPTPAKKPGNRSTGADRDAAGDIRGLRSGAAEVEPLPRNMGWQIFRGDRGLSGVAKGHLPDSLTLRWSFETGDAIKSSPVIGGGRVFIGSNDGKVYALSATTGKKAWEFNTGAAVEAPPLFLENTVYVGNLDGVFYAIDAVTGRKRWQFETGGAITGSANYVATPGGRAQHIVVGSYDNMMYCLDAASGRLVWKYETDNFINGAPAVADGKVIFGSCDASVHVLAAADGTEIVHVDTGSYIAASAAVNGGQAYVGNYANKLISVDLSGKTIAWEYGDEDQGAPFFSSPAVDEKRVVAGSRDRRLYCVARKDGRELWAFQTGGDIDSSPVICGTKVVVGSRDGRLYLVGLADGAEVTYYEIGSAITGSPAVTAPMVFVGAEDGRLYVFGPKAPGGGYGGKP